MQVTSSHTFSEVESDISESKGEPNQTESLVVEVKIKNKLEKSILIANIYDSDTIDKEIRWFLTTNNLKDQAFGYLKGIISKKVEEKKRKRLSKSKVYC